MLDHAPIIGGVAFGRCAEQVRHEVSVRFETEDAGELEGLLHAIDADPSMVRGKDALVEALDAHLQLRAAQAAQRGKPFGRDGIGAGFHHKAHAAVLCGLVFALQGFQLGKRCGLPLRGAASRYRRHYPASCRVRKARRRRPDRRQQRSRGASMDAASRSSAWARKRTSPARVPQAYRLRTVSL